MRENQDAPVDTQGAHCQADKKQDKKLQDFQTLVGLLLSVQTKDETTFMVMSRLKSKGFSLNMALKLSDEELK